MYRHLTQRHRQPHDGTLAASESHKNRRPTNNGSKSNTRVGGASARARCSPVFTPVSHTPVPYAYSELVQGTTTLTVSDNTNAGTGKKYQRAHRHLVLLLHILGHATTGMILVPHEQEASSKKFHVGGTRINHQRHIASGDIFEPLLSENVDAHLLISSGARARFCTASFPLANTQG